MVEDDADVQLLPQPRWVLTGAEPRPGLFLVMASPDLARWDLEAVYLDFAIVIPDGARIHESETLTEIDFSAKIQGRVAFATGSTWAEAMAAIARIMAQWEDRSDPGQPLVDHRRAALDRSRPALPPGETRS